MWFHAQKMPGSHVVLKAQGTHRGEYPCGGARAKHSQGKDATKVAVDYTVGGM